MAEDAHAVAALEQRAQGGWSSKTLSWLGLLGWSCLCCHLHLPQLLLWLYGSDHHFHKRRDIYCARRRSGLQQSAVFSVVGAGLQLCRLRGRGHLLDCIGGRLGWRKRSPCRCCGHSLGLRWLCYTRSTIRPSPSIALHSGHLGLIRLLLALQRGHRWLVHLLGGLRGLMGARP